MKTKTKRIVAVVLAVMMMVSVLCVSSFAANSSNVQHYNKYVILGDSVASGYGLVQGDDYYGYLRPQGLMITGMYGTLVSEEVGASEVVNYSRSGLRTSDLLRLLDTDFEYDAFSNTAIGYEGGTSLEDFEAMQSTVNDDLADADLITINIGSNDMFSQGLLYGTYVVNYGGLGYLNPAMIPAFLYGFAKGLVEFGGYWTQVINHIRSINDDATIVAIGLYNPYLHQTLVTDGNLEIGRLVDANTAIINMYLESMCDLRDEYEYCDVTGLADYVWVNGIGLLDSAWYDNIILNIHPTPEGHRYIADQIESVLPEGTTHGAVSTYSVTANNGGTNSGGSFYTNTSTAAAKEDVCITATPNDGYSVASVTATDANGNSISVKNEINNTYSFKMPSSSVTVNVTFTDGNGNTSGNTEENCPSAKFTDLNTSMWYHTYVDYVLNKGIMSGTSSTTFEPNSTLTRAMVATILYAMEGKPAVLGSAGFSDVNSSKWYSDPINWCASNGIVAGMGDGSFSPDSAVTREQLATMLKSYAQYKGKDTSANGDLSQFSDAEYISSWAFDNVGWAVGNGIISGKGNGIIDPTGTATRAEAATMFTTFCRNILGQG